MSNSGVLVSGVLLESNGHATAKALSMATSAGISRPLRSGSPKISEFDLSHV
mgnify:CR=1 FL=1